MDAGLAGGGEEGAGAAGERDEDAGLTGGGDGNARVAGGGDVAEPTGFAGVVAIVVAARGCWADSMRAISARAFFTHCRSVGRVSRIVYSLKEASASSVRPRRARARQRP